MPKEYKNSFILFFVTRREGVRVKEVNEVKAEIKETLENKKEEQAKNSWLQELHKNYPIEINKTPDLM